jgi:pilus assembly protein FimV
MRALARWGITPLLAAPLGAWALGLGDIELQSALNQPFQAQIVLVSATPEEVQGLQIALATRETFERYGLERAGFLSALEFRVVRDGAGRDVVRISSRQSIAEPFVTMLVEATWPRGRLLREYTVLLDPPVLLPGPAAPAPVRPAQSRPADPSSAAGPIDRPAPPPQRQPAPGASSNVTPAPAPRLPAESPGGTYGPVQRAETLWRIAERFRPEGVSMNQIMVAVFQANPQAFADNMNLLQVGATLRIPDAADLRAVNSGTATAEVQRQSDEWLGRPQQAPRLVLVPATEAEETPAPVSVQPADETQARQAPAQEQTQDPGAGAAAASEQSRLIEVRDEQLQSLQEQLAADEAPAAEPAEPQAADPAVAPGVDLESEQLFADEAEEPAPAEAEPPAPVVTPPTIVARRDDPSLVSQILGWLAAPLLWIALGVGALLLTALWYVRRRRHEPEDVTGRWEALESEVDDDEAREATARMRRQVQDENFVVEEQAARPRRVDLDADLDLDLDDDEPRPARVAHTPAPAPAPADDTLSSQTVINLDQADPVAEADFHMAYGLYDQAAELVSKALEAAPNRRDLKLKLLEVFFVWGNKDAFLGAAKDLREEIGQRPDADWDKVVIMGKQICPDEALFAEATSAGAHVDVALDAGDSPALDLSFDDGGSGGMDLDLTEASGSGEFEIETSAERQAKQARATASRMQDTGGSLDIGERTAAGLEAALFFEQDDDAGRKTVPDVDTLAVTQESPTVETSGAGRNDWSSFGSDTPTEEVASVDAPTVETPTIESAGPEAPTMETPTIESRYGSLEPPTVEQPGIAGNASDRTAEIDLDDLGLDVKDLEDLPVDLGDLPVAAGSESDTREQPALTVDDELLSATGVTQVLRVEDDDEFEQRKTAVLADEDATMLSPGYDNTLTGTEVLEHRFEFDESGDTSLVKSLRRDDGLDLNLDDLSAALQGADTVEQPRSSSFSGDVFGGNGQTTPVDIDIGSELIAMDDPTGTEEISPLDPQTMTEVGTKLDLARAYIDMGDPEGARSILEEVLDEGDPSQRREAQSLIDVLSA